MRFTATGSYRNPTCFPEQLGLIIMLLRRIVNHKFLYKNDCYLKNMCYNKGNIKSNRLFFWNGQRQLRANPSGTKPP